MQRRTVRWRVPNGHLATGLFGLVAGWLFVTGCSPEQTLNVANTGSTSKVAPPVVPDAGPSAPVLPPLAKVEFNEGDFVEGDHNRDPFRTYASLFAPTLQKHVGQNQRNIVLSQFSLDELKLVAIVTGGDYPRAMVTDPHGKGWVLKRGDFVGRPEVVHLGGVNGAEYSLNWRVDRVREGELVFLREDPAQPGIAPASRVIALHPEPQDAKDKID